MRGQVPTKEIELNWREQVSYRANQVATVDRGYHVYVAVWEKAVGQILPCEREGDNINDPDTVAVVEIMTPIDNDASLPTQRNFSRLKLSRTALKPRKSRKFLPSKDSRYTAYN